MALATGTRLGGRTTAPPDPDPAVRLAELLACARRAGMPWSDRAYGLLTSRVVRDLEASQRKDWEFVFAEQAAVWKAAYERTLIGRHYLERSLPRCLGRRWRRRRAAVADPEQQPRHERR
jgi:hypothetical protein